MIEHYKTSKEWKQLKCPDTVILDFDGWNRKNLEFSFNEEPISEREFEKRLFQSTTLINDSNYKAKFLCG